MRVRTHAHVDIKIRIVMFVAPKIMWVNVSYGVIRIRPFDSKQNIPNAEDNCRSVTTNMF
jgi:hypothetical protein